MVTGSVEINFVSKGVVQWAFDKIVSCIPLSSHQKSAFTT